MALSAMFILEVVIVFSFVVTSLFMFIPKKNEAVHKIFFVLSVMLGILVTFISTTTDKICKCKRLPAGFALCLPQ